MVQKTFMVASWFGWLTKLSTWLADCWCHPSYKKDKWQGMEFVTSDINLDLFCSNQESSPAQQILAFNMRLSLVLSFACADIQLKNETGERTLLGSSTCKLISEPEKELSMKGSWGSLTFTFTFKALLLQSWAICKSCLHTQEMLQRYTGKWDLLMFSVKLPLEMHCFSQFVLGTFACRRNSFNSAPHLQLKHFYKSAMPVLGLALNLSNSDSWGAWSPVVYGMKKVKAWSYCSHKTFARDIPVKRKLLQSSLKESPQEHACCWAQAKESWAMLSLELHGSCGLGGDLHIHISLGALGLFSLLMAWFTRRGRPKCNQTFP